MTVREILEAQLRAGGFDGIYHPGDCACFLGDLAPCGGDPMDCKTGYRAPCGPDCDHEGAEPGAWHIQETKPAAGE